MAKQETLPKRGTKTMKHVMKSLKHNGIYVPPYDLKGFTIKIQGQTIKLTEKRAYGGGLGTQSPLNYYTTTRQGFHKELYERIPRAS